jgi:hypothetical protein
MEMDWPSSESHVGQWEGCVAEDMVDGLDDVLEGNKNSFVRSRAARNGLASGAPLRPYQRL